MSKRLLHTPEGVRDIYGKEYAAKLSVEHILQDTVRSYGYEAIQTPTFEYFDVFSKKIGTTPSKELYKFFDKEGNTLVLRPDFTPSIARCAAKYFMEETAPIRFCYTGNTFTNTSSLRGKRREVTQLGAELINDGSVEADAEMISLVVEMLKRTGLERFQITIGQADYFRGLCEEAGMDQETEEQLREYVSGKNYFAAQELLQERGTKEPCHSVFLKVADIAADRISLSEARQLAGNPRSLEAIARLERLYGLLKLYGAAEYVSFDLGMLSRYHYYTGVIFKAYTYGIGDAIVKGGRYDTLLSRFGKEAPAVGFVAVIDDLLDALSRQKVAVALPAAGKTVVYTEADFAEKLALARALRTEGHAVELTPAGKDNASGLPSSNGDVSFDGGQPDEGKAAAESEGI